MIRITIMTQDSDYDPDRDFLREGYLRKGAINKILGMNPIMILVRIRIRIYHKIAVAAEVCTQHRLISRNIKSMFLWMKFWS